MKPKKEEKPIPTTEEILNSLRTNEDVQKYLEQFRPESTESFLKFYAGQVAHVLKYGPQQEEQEKEKPFEFLDEAELCLWEIQQKKLFNLQCLWRAEKIEIPGVESTCDFDYWEHYIQSCPFVPPITQAEVDLYIEFLLSGHRLSDWGFGTFQDYEMFKEELASPEEDTSMPYWYEFYDLRMGTSAYLILPDIRGQKEEIYLDIWRNHGKEEREAKQKEYQKQQLARDTRPWMHIGDEDMVLFAEKFADDHTRKYIKKEVKRREDNKDKPDTMDDYFFLDDIEEYVSFEPHYDWREQMRLTVIKYKNTKTAEAMSAAFESYQMRMETGIGYPHQIEYFEMANGEKRDTWAMVLNIKEHILDGRAINGEPRDWNF